MKIVLLPFGLPVVVDRFLLLCLAIVEKGEVSRSDGGVEYTHIKTFISTFSTPLLGAIPFGLSPISLS